MNVSQKRTSVCSHQAGFSKAAGLLRERFARIRNVPMDERGTISILSVITVFVLTIVLGMVINAGREVDEKVRLQNAADAATYSGGVVIARGMNALAFANHLEGEIFGLVATLRAQQAMNPEQDPTVLNFEYAILDAWNIVGQNFASSSFQKFTALGPAIQNKVPLEKQLVKTFLEMGGLQSKLILDPLESILRGPNVQPGGTPDPLGGVIPRFQRAVVLTTPQTAQMAAAEIARMHGNMTTTGKVSGLEKLHQLRPLTAVLWRTGGMPVALGNEQDPLQRTLRVFDPSLTGLDAPSSSSDYVQLARCQRRRWAQNTMTPWLQDFAAPFYRGIPGWGPGGSVSAKMSVMFPVYYALACGALNKLLDVDYYGTNLPFVYRVPNNGFQGASAACPTPTGGIDCNCLEFGSAAFPGYRLLMYENVDPRQSMQQPSYLEQTHSFVGVVYWPAMQQTSSLYFRYPLASDAMAFAEVSVFLPQARYLYSQPSGGSNPEFTVRTRLLGGMDSSSLPGIPGPPWQHQVGTDSQTGTPIMQNNHDFWPQVWLNPIHDLWTPVWDLTSQNWMAKLAPATSDSVASILQNSLAQQFAPGVRQPNLGSIAPVDLRRINTH